MKATATCIIICVSVFSYLLPIPVRGQICAVPYQSITYKGYNFADFTKSIIGPSQDIFSTANLYHEDGIMTRFSPRGSVLWSNQYSVKYAGDQVFYKDLLFSDAVIANDSNFLAAGSLYRYYMQGTAVLGNVLGVLIRVDKFGNPAWTKTFRSILGEDLSVTNVIQTTDMDLVIYLASDNGSRGYAYGKVIRMNAQGQIKWSSQLFTDLFDGTPAGMSSKRGLIQARDGSIVISDMVYQRDRTVASLPVTESDLHIASLDYTTGKLRWETSYEFQRPDPAFRPEIAGMRESSDGSFQIFTSLYIGAPGQPSATQKGIILQTDNTGHVNKVTALFTSQAARCRILDVVKDPSNGLATCLLENDGKTILANMQENGSINWQRAYDDAGGQFPPNCATAGINGYAIMQGNFNSWTSRLLLTHSQGEITCVEQNLPLLAETTVFTGHSASVVTDIDNRFSDPYEASGVNLRATAYTLEKKVTCEESVECCRDIIDSTHIMQVSLCAGKTYMLPDQTVVSDSGRYYVTYKTRLGCDSVRFYDVHQVIDPAQMKLGMDTCLVDGQPITLHATPGFGTYNWMGTNLSSPMYTVNVPGNYWVKVSNTCGSKTDSLRVYEACDFEIYMPSAFTPNQDNLNDYFGIPPTNANILVSLRIYDRWGQLVYEQRAGDKGWDGKYKGLPMPTGVFAYQLEMKGLSGRPLFKKGIVTLIR